MEGNVKMGNEVSLKEVTEFILQTSRYKTDYIDGKGKQKTTFFYLSQEARAALVDALNTKINLKKIEWRGEKCPVSGDTAVRVWFRDGTIWNNEEAGELSWRHTGGARDIIAYEVIEE